MNKHLRNFMNLKNKKSVLKAISIAALATVAFTGCTQQGGQQLDANAGKYAPGEKLKVAFAYVGVVGDAGWTYAHDVARREVEKKFGDKVETSFVELVNPDVDGSKILNAMAVNGNHVIFGTTWGYGPIMKSLASDYPNIKFEHATGAERAKNISTYDAKTYEGAYLSGIIAGATTKSNVLGYIGSVPIPEVYRNINSFTLGARSVNPEATVKVSWVGDWFNEQKERESALSLITQGSDVLFQNTDSPAPLSVAEEKGVRAFGWDSDMSAYGPKAHLASSIINWAPYYEKTIQSALDGNWESGNIWGGVKEGMIDVVSLARDIPRSGVRSFREAKEKMAEGSLNVWVGPMKKNNGEEFLKAGEEAQIGQLMGMSFFVEGVDPNAPLK